MCDQSFDMPNLKTLLIFFFGFTLISCEKEEGEGGKARITGSVYVYDVSALTGDTLAEYDGMEERVYIVYGDNSIFDDEVRTHYDGTYQFKYLTKGDYTVFVYTDCDTCPSEQAVILREVKIDEKKQEVVVPQFNIINLK